MAMDRPIIDLLWRVRPSIRFCLSFCDVRSKGEAFSSRRCKLKKFNVVQPKTPIISLFVREMLRPYESSRITREPDAVKGNRLPSRDRASGIVSIHGCRTGSKFPVPNFQLMAPGRTSDLVPIFSFSVFKQLPYSVL